MIRPNPVSVRLYGARPGRADNQIPINAALANESHVLLDGFFPCDGQVVLQHGQTVVGKDPTSGMGFSWASRDDGPAAHVRTGLSPSAVGTLHLAGFRIVGGHDGTPWGPNPGGTLGAHALQVSGLEDFTIDSLQIINAPFFALHHTGSQRGRITNLLIQGSGRDGCTGYGSLTRPIRDVTINNCVIVQTGDDCVGVHSLPDSSGVPIYTLSLTAGSRTVTVVGGSPTINVGSVVDVDGGGPFGVPFHGLVVQVVSPTEFVVDHPAAVTITASATVDYPMAESVAIIGNVLRNSVTPASLDLGRAIALDSVVNCTVFGNVLGDSWGNSIDVTPTHPWVWSRGVDLRGNPALRPARIQTSPGSSVDSGQQLGMRLWGVADSVVEVNLRGALGDGVYVKDAHRVQVSGVVQGCGSHGVIVDGTNATHGTAEVTVDVDCHDNGGNGVRLTGASLVRLSARTNDNGWDTTQPLGNRAGVRIIGNTPLTLIDGSGTDTRPPGVKTQWRAVHSDETTNTLIIRNWDGRGNLDAIGINAPGVLVDSSGLISAAMGHGRTVVDSVGVLDGVTASTPVTHGRIAIDSVGVLDDVTASTSDGGSPAGFGLTPFGERFGE